MAAAGTGREEEEDGPCRSWGEKLKQKCGDNSAAEQGPYRRTAVSGSPRGRLVFPRALCALVPSCSLSRPQFCLVNKLDGDEISPSQWASQPFPTHPFSVDACP